MAPDPAMPRRTPYTKVRKVGQVRPPHVRGMGDVVFRAFQRLRRLGRSEVQASAGEGGARGESVPHPVLRGFFV